MSNKTFIWICASFGAALGGFVPSLWGADLFSFSGIILSMLGGLFGVWIGYKLSQY